ncbi:MAG: YggS family pyridoxal phosphate-dependent enzyme [Gammaproteobacteria bacterium]|nr:YggS family pyridoxal phosphate-dependent enzyme [Gammaproteobacteria bacterium]
MHSVSNSIAHVRARMSAAARAAGRDPAEITLIGVSKTRTAPEIRDALAAGLQDVGENYVNEALPKIEALRDRPACWHFIGAIQSNKTRNIADAFDWVHTIDRVKIARRLAEQRNAARPALDVLIQVNIDDEPQKAGVSVDGLSELVAAVATLGRLRLRGLMAIPHETHDATAKRRSFHRLAQLFEEHRPVGSETWDTLSMGMSADFEIAIAEGATMVRVGTAIFGERG